MKEKLPYVKDFNDLIAYKKAVDLAGIVFEITKGFPKEELFSLTDQIRRSSRSIGAQVAESWAKRRYIRHFTSKLTDAMAEINETLHWIDIAHNCGYLSRASTEELKSRCVELNRLISGMAIKSNQFCRNE